jgi:hypothetical protein
MSTSAEGRASQAGPAAPAGQRARLKETLKALRAERGDLVAAAVARNKARQAERKLVREALAAGPATVPGLAAATGLPTKVVLWHVAAMRKYGELVEHDVEGDYCRYRLTGQGGGEA